MADNYQRGYDRGRGRLTSRLQGVRSATGDQRGPMLVPHEYGVCGMCQAGRHDVCLSPLCRCPECDSVELGGEG